MTRATQGKPERPVYPPPGQVLSALGIEVRWSDQTTLRGRAAVDLDLLGRDGRPSGVGALVPIVDLLAGVRVTEVADGDWLATSDLWLNERAPMTSGPIELTTRLLRVGRRTAVTAVEVEAGGVGVASATVEFTRIRRDARAPQTTGATAGDGWTRLGSGPLLDHSLESACGFAIAEPGHGRVELANAPFVANSTGTLQGGVAALLADVAAADLVGPGARTVDLAYRFLAPTGAGPARTSAAIVRVDGAHHVVNVEVVDASDGRLVGWATCGVLAG